MTMQKTNKAVYNYLISCIDLSDYGIDAKDMTKKLIIGQLISIIEKETQTQAVNITPKIIENWLRGLCCVKIEFWDYKISDLLVLWNIKPTQRNIKNYWCVMSFRLYQMIDFYLNAKKPTNWFFDEDCNTPEIDNHIDNCLKA